MGAITMQQIARAYLEQREELGPMRLDAEVALRAVLACRTAELGGRELYCPHGHESYLLYNQCQHRSCDLHSAGPIARWVEKKMELLLPVAGHHAVVTLSSEVRELWRYNRKVVGDALFGAGAEAVKILLHNGRYLGALPGIVAVLHTAGSVLESHLHLHLVVTAGGLNEEGQWVEPRREDLLPERAVATLFKRLFVRRLRRGLEQGALVLPEGWGPEQVEQFLGEGKKKRRGWHVWIGQRMPSSLSTIKYLAEALRGGPLRSEQLLGLDEGGVRFWYWRWRGVGRGERPPRRMATLSVETFVERWLEHVPPKGAQMARCYGLYANASGEKLSAARAALGVRSGAELAEPVEEPEPAEVSRPEKSRLDNPRCPACRQEMVQRELEPQPPVRLRPMKLPSRPMPLRQGLGVRRFHVPKAG